MLRLLALLLIAGCVSAIGLFIYLHDWANSSGTITDIPRESTIITRGTVTEAIIQELYANNTLTGAPWQVKAWLLLQQWRGDPLTLKAGEYMFYPGITPKQVFRALHTHDVVTHYVAIPEGFTSRKIRERLLADTRLQGALPDEIPEGSLLPETYAITRGEARVDVLTRMQHALDVHMQILWDDRAESLPYDTVEDALIMASIIEAETGISGERARIAGVFVNRLNKRMPLQSDPTVTYGIELEEGLMNRPLYRSDWKRDHPWNSYTRRGLPPTPICHPGKAAIAAALHPLESDDLYFVATGKGGHYFAKSLKEHNRNIQLYRANRK